MLSPCSKAAACIQASRHGIVVTIMMGNDDGRIAFLCMRVDAAVDGTRKHGYRC
jgi:hypothetical protein